MRERPTRDRDQRDRPHHEGRGPDRPRPKKLPIKDPNEPRRALSNTGGSIRTHGDPQYAPLFGEALSRTATEPPDILTHGFHAWPARMHHAIPGTIFAELGVRGARVLDPCAGGGTVLVEAMRHGARGIGIDLNPLSPIVVSTKCALRDGPEQQAFLAAAEQVVMGSLERVQTRTPIVANLPREMVSLYAPHVLKELAGLLEEIRLVESERDARALAAVFSSLVVKLSNKKADTSELLTEKRLRKGLASELFARKSDELAQRWDALFHACPPDAEEPRLFVGDARRIGELLGPRVRADFVVTSPPYGGTYDYYAHHALRLAWLDLPDAEFEASEMGSRRTLKGESAAGRFDHEMRAFLRAVRGVVADDGLVVFVIGDADFGGSRVPALDQLDALAPLEGLRLLAGASETKHDFRGGAPREEHVIAMTPVRDNASFDRRR